MGFKAPTTTRETRPYFSEISCVSVRVRDYFVLDEALTRIFDNLKCTGIFTFTLFYIKCRPHYMTSQFCELTCGRYRTPFVL